MRGCDHDAPERFRVCCHLLLEGADTGHLVRFTGRGLDRELLCRACADGRPDLREVCAACRDAAAAAGDWIGIAGAPEIAEQASPLWFEHRRVSLDPHAPELVEAQPLLGPDRNCWIGATADGRLYHVDLDRPATRPIARVPDGAIDPDQPVALQLSRDGRLAAVVNRRGIRGVVLDLETGRPTVTLARDGYCAEHCNFPVAFVERGGRQLVVHAPAWNRLDVLDARTGELLTARGPTSYTGDEPQPPHYLDYFHCGLTVSPDQRHLADNGWVWHPFGVVCTWSLERWLGDNVWESEDGPSRRDLCGREGYWDGPLCWLDDARLAVWGYGNDERWLLPAVRIFDVRSGAEERWFPGPRGSLFFDRVLVSADEQEGASVWSVERGARLLRDPEARPARYHPTAKSFVTLPLGGAMVSRLCGHDADAPWNDAVVAELARTIARDRSFDDLPVLGDALEAAGCPDLELLSHCQRPGPHADRCWVLDRLARG